MRKLFALLLVLLVAFAPMSFAIDKICELAGSDSYVEAASGKLMRGVANAAFGWVELLRQPSIQPDIWNGIGQGLVQTIARTGSGIFEVATFIVPDAKIPTPSPACPLEMLGSEKAGS
ncbi:MAG: hypothetical protein HYS55_03095 [Candidatus Omnitrophica bacterium]|nr:hypothetical protein [Candidatus Omnitrophota bacterium]